MKTWMAKFKVSKALDDGGVALERRSTRGAEREEVRQYEEAARVLDRRLKSAQPSRPVPTELHDSIMRAVRGAARTREPHSAPMMLRWLPAPALVLLIVAGVWWASNRTENKPQPLTTAGTVLERSHELTQQAPAAVLAPLSKEMESLNRDFRNAVEFLVASVP